MAAQQNKFEHAAAMLTVAADQSPDFPGVQSALGIASFNAQRYQAAAGPLTRALAADPRQRSPAAHAGAGVAERRGL